MKISVNRLKKYIQIILDCSLCLGAFSLWIDAWSFITTKYLLFVCIVSFCLNCKRRDIIYPEKLYLLWLIFALSVIINTIFSSDIMKSFSFVKSLIAMIVVTLVFSKRESNSEVSGKFIIMLSFILSLSIIWEFVDFNSFKQIAVNIFSSSLYSEISMLRGSFNRYVGFGVYSGPAACLLIYGICASLAYLKKGIWFYFILGINSFSIVLTGSRTLLIMIFIVWACYQLYMKTLAEKRLTTPKVFVYIIMIFVFGCVAVGFVMNNLSSLRLFDGSATNASVNVRFRLYNYAISLFLDNPIVGTGINTFLNYSTANPAVEDTYTHNLILQSLAEQGIIGCTLLIGSIGLTYIYILNRWKKGIRTNSIKFSILVQTVFIIYSMVGNPFYDLNLRLIYFVAVMIGLREGNSKYS